MAQQGDEGYGGTHCNEDYGDFRQAAPCKSAYLRVSRVLQRSDSDEGDARSLKNKFNNWTLMQCFTVRSDIKPSEPRSAGDLMLPTCCKKTSRKEEAKRKESWHILITEMVLNESKHWNQVLNSASVIKFDSFFLFFPSVYDISVHIRLT